MSEPTIVNLTLEFVLRIPSSDIEVIDLIAETMMQGAVDATKRDVSGLGYNYDYTHKKSRRGLTIRKGGAK